MSILTKADERDPKHHSAKIRDMLSGVIDHVRSDVDKVNDPQAQALFETTAEVLTGLRTAYEHFEQGFGEGVAEGRLRRARALICFDRTRTA